MALTDSLIHYWKMDAASGNESDSVGSITLTENVGGGVGSATGIINTARDFESSSDRWLYSLDDATLDTGDEDFTWQAWVKLESKAAYGIVLVKQDDNFDNRKKAGYYLLYNFDLDRFEFVVGDGTTSATVTDTVIGSPSTGTWYLLHGWHDASANQIGLAINAGTADTTSYSSGSHNTNVFYTGTQETGGVSVAQWDGLIDEVGFWRRVLTSGERTSLYNGGAGLAYPFASAPYDEEGLTYAVVWSW